jgi:Predicted nucleotide-binding protein containing TIR-like domain
MEPIKPLIFAGGSREKSQLLICLTSELQPAANVHPWWSSDAFHPLGGTLEGLLSATKKYDFAIFILTPDDFIKSREAKSFTARDNVLFEFGLFLGTLGAKRTLAFAQDDPTIKLKVPSDLFGVTIPRFRANSDEDIRTSMVGLRRHIEKMIEIGPRPFEILSEWGIEHKKRRFVVTLDPERMRAHADKIQGRELVLVCRKQDPLIARDSDAALIVGEPRTVHLGERRISLFVDMSDRFNNFIEGDYIEGYPFLLPRKIRLSICKTMQDLKDAGCLRLDHVGCQIG